MVSKSFVTVKYGMIETRVRVPNLDLGGWPAVWMLGTANYAVARLRRGRHDGDGRRARRSATCTTRTTAATASNNSTVNQMVGANAIYYSAGAVTPGNPSGAASLAYDPADVYDRPYYNYANPLAGRFLIYRLYWDENSMRFTVVDDGVEHDLYAHPFVIDGRLRRVPRSRST